MAQPIIIGSVVIYAAMLFWIAWRVDNSRPDAEKAINPALIFSLSIAVYCTSWTFYGAVGTAQTRGWEYVPIYLGPMLVFSLGRPLLRRMVETGKRIHSTSIADFISAHYRKSRGIAALVTLIAVFGALPYIALQLKSVSTTFSYLSGADAANLIDTDLIGVLLVALTLAVFAIMFGTRNIDITRPNRGMIAAIAFDSIIKLAALIAVGLFAVGVAAGDAFNPGEITHRFEAGSSVDRFVTLTVLSVAAILCLPRQFHVAVVECRDPKNLGPASNFFLGYLLIITVLAAPIATVGMASPTLAGVPADLTVLALPLAHGAEALALGVFVGGFAAATAMVIVASVALSTMITNDLIAPFMLHEREIGSTPPKLGRRLLKIRRMSIFMLLVFAALFAAFAPEGEQLASFGILSFAAAAQFMPALIGALYWSRVQERAAFWGMAGGFALWFVTLFAPSYFGEGASWMLAVTAWMAPLQWDPLTEGVAISLGLNAVIFVFLSLLPAHVQKREESPFSVPPIAESDARVRAGDLYLLIQRCLGEEAGLTVIREFEHGRTPDPLRVAGPALIAFTDQQISRAIGASSARILLKSVLSGGTLQLDDVATLLGETSGRVQFSREILQATLEHTSHGIAVVDADLRLVAWNKAYIDMYEYPPELIQDGRPIEDLIRFNAKRGEMGVGDIEQQVKRRLAHLRAGKRHSYERMRPNGVVVLIEGVRSPGGLYVTTFTDVTAYKHVEKALTESERSVRFYTDNVPAMTSFVDREQRFLFANSAYRRAFHLHEDDIGVKKLKDVLTTDEYALRKPHIDAALRGERATFDIEMRDNGARKFMQVAYVPQLRPDGELRGFFGIYQDVTARRQAELALARTNETLEERVEIRTRELIGLNAALDQARKEAEEATASKTRFLAAASHDVLQPLNAARLFVSALKESASADHETQGLADKIDASIGSADRLLRSLLNISKLDAGGVRPEFSPFALNDLFDELANDFAIAARNKGIDFRIVSTSAWINSDRGLLLSALQNIVSNAVRYTDQGKVLIGAKRQGDNLRIDVYDTGRGIAGHRRRDVFQEFKRLERDQDVAGAGLGLATVQRIAKLLNAELELQSTEGVGSRFSLAAPKAGKGAEQSSSLHGQAPRALKGMRIICIDNDQLVLDAMHAALSRWQAEILTFRSASEALAEARAVAAAPDLLLIDYQLDAGQTGFDALAVLERRWGVRPLTIMITASSSGAAEARAAKLNIPVLAKPVEPAQLRALIHQMRRRAAE